MNFKKILLPILFLLIPLVINAEACEPEKVVIESIKVNNKTDNVVEKSAPSVSGRDLNLDLEMFEVGDTIEYVMVVKNGSSSDYELDKTSLSKSSDFIEYILETKDNSTIVKAGEEKEVLVRVQYKNQVSDDSYVDGVYQDTKNLAVNLSSEEPESPIVNPKTGIYTTLIIIPILVISAIVAIALRKKRYGSIMAIILGLIVIVPTSVYAICKCSLNVDSKVEVLKAKKVCIYVGEGGCSPAKMSEYKKRMVFVPLETTVGQFLTSQREKLTSELSESDARRLGNGLFVKSGIDACENTAIERNKNGTTEWQVFYNELNSCHDEFTEPLNTSEEYLNSPVKESTEGCYNFTIGSIC